MPPPPPSHSWGRRTAPTAQPPAPGGATGRGGGGQRAPSTAPSRPCPRQSRAATTSKAPPSWSPGTWSSCCWRSGGVPSPPQGSAPRLVPPPGRRTPPPAAWWGAPRARSCSWRMKPGGSWIWMSPAPSTARRRPAGLGEKQGKGLPSVLGGGVSSSGHPKTTPKRHQQVLISFNVSLLGCLGTQNCWLLFWGGRFWAAFFFRVGFGLLFF